MACEAGILAQLGAAVKHLVTDSRKVRPGDVFAAYPGERRDGRDFIAQAVAAGADGVLWEPTLSVGSRRGKCPTAG